MRICHNSNPEFQKSLQLKKVNSGSGMKKYILIFFLLILSIFSFVLYWNNHFYYKALGKSQSNERIAILQDANQYFPFNDLVYYELGKVFYELGMQNLNDAALSTSLFQQSVSNFQRSCLLNPASQFCHFNLARALFYLSVENPIIEMKPEEELKKAALLVDNNSEIFLEVGLLFLGRWQELTEEDKAFALDISSKILETRKGDKILSLFRVWEININDYELLKSILPLDIFVYRTLAEYLGERSLYLKERQELLTQAEFLEFQTAQRDNQKGENDFYHFNLRDAFQSFESCLTRLRRIRFYQDLTQQNIIDAQDYVRLEKSVYLNLAKCRIEENRSLEGSQNYLEEYIRMEEDVRALKDLESYLMERRIIDKKFEGNFDNLHKVYFQFLLAYKQKRYAEIIRTGRLIQTSYLVITDDVKTEFIKILQIIGDAFHRAGHVYDATDFYMRAFELDSENIDTLIKILRNYERLNDEAGVRQTHQNIEKALFPKNINIRNSLIKKRHRSSQRMILDGREIILELFFEKTTQGVASLASIHFNGHVVWEDYLKGDLLTLQLDTKIGENILQVVAVNKDLSFKRMTYKILE
jgi:hypothetical protein